MNADDLIAMHKVTERVIETVSQDGGMYIETDDVCARRDEALRDAIRDLAVIQRDLLAAALGR